MHRHGFIVIFALTASLVVPGCASTDDERPERRVGDALAPGAEQRFGDRRPFAPGEELILMVASLRNVADEPFTIERISLEGLERDDVAEVVRVWVAPRGGAAPLPSLGLYQTLPPVEDSPTGEGCAVQELVPVRGTAIRPSRGTDDYYLLAIHLRAARPGVFRFESIRVEYTRNGERFHETIPYGMSIVVANGQRRPMDPIEKRCLRHTRALP